MEMMTVISRPFAHLHICTWVLHRNAQQQPQHCNDLLDDVLHCSSSDDCHLQFLPSPGTTITLHEHCHLLDIQIFIVIQIGYRGYILERRNSKVFGSFLFMTYFPFDTCIILGSVWTWSWWTTDYLGGKSWKCSHSSTAALMLYFLSREKLSNIKLFSNVVFRCKLPDSHTKLLWSTIFSLP